MSLLARRVGMTELVDRLATPSLAIKQISGESSDTVWDLFTALSGQITIWIRSATPSGCGLNRK